MVDFEGWLMGKGCSGLSPGFRKPLGTRKHHQTETSTSARHSTGADTSATQRRLLKSWPYGSRAEGANLRRCGSVNGGADRAMDDKRWFM
jgi:hypothetical protein